MKYKAFTIFSLIFALTLLFASCKIPSSPQIDTPDQTQGGDAGSTLSPSDSITTEESASNTVPADSGSETKAPETEAPATSHVHIYDQKVENEEYLIFTSDESFCTAYIYSCKCGARGDSKVIFGAKAHSGGVATCTERAICEVCGKEYGDMAEHVFDKEIYAPQYLTKASTCTENAIYKKSCVCGLASATDSFTVESAGHSFKNNTCTVCNFTNYYTTGLKFDFNFPEKYYILSDVGSAVNNTSIHIPAYHNGYPVRAINGDAFQNCTNLRELVIPETVESFVIYAPNGTENVTHLTLSYIKNLRTPINEIFPNLECVYFSENTKIAHYLSKLKKLKYVYFPEGISNIGSLWKCESLTYVYIPDSVTNIKNDCFSECKNLKYVYLPDSVTSIGINAFKDCTSLEYVSLPKNLTSIGNNAFENCSKLTSIQLPSTLEKLGTDAFWGTQINDITIPEAVMSNPTGILQGNKVLEHCTFPIMKQDNNTNNHKNDKYVRKVFNYGIDYEDKSLYSTPDIHTYDAICDSITLYGNECITAEVFKDCEELKKLVIDPSSELTLNISAFLNCTGIESLSVPYGIIPKNSQGSIHFCTVFGFIKDNYKSHPIPKTLKEVYIVDADTIPDHFFDGCTSIERIVITGNVKNIGAYAFYGCVNLKEIILPDSVEVIGEGAFMGCDSLEKIKLPSSLREIGDSAFSRCGLKYVDIPDSVNRIGAKAFEICTRLTAVDLPLSLKKIDMYAFFECNSLKKIIYEGNANWEFYLPDSDSSETVRSEILSMPSELALALRNKLTHGSCVTSYTD